MPIVSLTISSSAASVRVRGDERLGTSASTSQPAFDNRDDRQRARPKAPRRQGNYQKREGRPGPRQTESDHPVSQWGQHGHGKHDAIQRHPGGPRPARRHLALTSSATKGDSTQTVKRSMSTKEGFRWPTWYMKRREAPAPATHANMAKARARRKTSAPGFAGPAPFDSVTGGLMLMLGSRD